MKFHLALLDKNIKFVSSVGKIRHTCNIIMEEDIRICLNCGLRSEGKFCPECGQSLSTGRFNMMRLGMHFILSLTRMSANFLRTAYGLLRYPWNVVRDYVYGKRVGLVSPVSMLLLLALYWGVIMAVIPKFSQSAQIEAMNLSGMLKWLYGSITFQYLFLAIPIALGTWAIYYRDMRERFNFAELIIATLYLACTFLLIDLVFIPLEITNDTLADFIIIIVTAVYGVLSILKAFPQKSKIITAIKLLLWCMICGALLFVFLMIFALPMYKDYL